MRKTDNLEKKTVLENTWNAKELHSKNRVVTLYDEQKNFNPWTLNVFMLQMLSNIMIDYFPDPKYEVLIKIIRDIKENWSISKFILEIFLRFFKADEQENVWFIVSNKQIWTIQNDQKNSSLSLEATSILNQKKIISEYSLSWKLQHVDLLLIFPDCLSFKINFQVIRKIQNWLLLIL